MHALYMRTHNLYEQNLYPKLNPTTPLLKHHEQIMRKIATAELHRYMLFDGCLTGARLERKC